MLKWRGPENGKEYIEKAFKEDLLSLKIISDDLQPEEAAKTGNVSMSLIRDVLSASAEKGILIADKSGIAREGGHFYNTPNSAEEYLTAETFTLQWHITQACDLNCKHCYDRSKRSPLTLKQGIYILDDLSSFCDIKKVDGHVCFTGGNPFMYDRFNDLYKSAVDHGFSTSILGNPTPREKLEKIGSIRKPSYFQVSLEGLEEHNDSIRGPGHFRKVMEFMDVLREMKISPSVMLTLTGDNIDQVLPLAGILKDKTDHFTFNRLSQVGKGADLSLPSREKYISFLDAYVDEAEKNKVIGFKDNLINTALNRKKRKLFDGCTGYGCGAAFNFVTLLPDGEVHACRKFPSPIGNVLASTIHDIYESVSAKLYRQGPASCEGCSLRPVCGGCMAVVNGAGLNIFHDRDPYCFINEKSQTD
jgi:MoaA/NifB/PqqE/SkfB family radical SAM enzyme